LEEPILSFCVFDLCFDLVFDLILNLLILNGLISRIRSKSSQRVSAISSLNRNVFVDNVIGRFLGLATQSLLEFIVLEQGVHGFIRHRTKI